MSQRERRNHSLGAAYYIRIFCVLFFKYIYSVILLSELPILIEIKTYRFWATRGYTCGSRARILI